MFSGFGARNNSVSIVINFRGIKTNCRTHVASNENGTVCVSKGVNMEERDAVHSQQVPS